MVRHLDASAFVTLVALEDESLGLRAWFSAHEAIGSSRLLHPEAMRSAARLGIDAEVVEDALEAVSLVRPGVTTFATAAPPARDPSLARRPAPGHGDGDR